MGEWQVEVQGQEQVRVQVLMSRCWLARGRRGTGTQQHGKERARTGGQVGGGEQQQQQQQQRSIFAAIALRNTARPGRRRLGRKGLNRGLHVRGTPRGSQMVSHKWFTATCRCMSGVRPVWVIGDVVLPAPAAAETGTASPPYTREMQRKKGRAFWRRQEGGDWASVDEAGLDVWMYGCMDG